MALILTQGWIKSSRGRILGRISQGSDKVLHNNTASKHAADFGADHQKAPSSSVTFQLCIFLFNFLADAPACSSYMPQVRFASKLLRPQRFLIQGRSNKGDKTTMHKRRKSTTHLGRRLRREDRIFPDSCKTQREGLRRKEWRRRRFEGALCSP